MSHPPNIFLSLEERGNSQTGIESLLIHLTNPIKGHRKDLLLLANAVHHSPHAQSHSSASNQPHGGSGHTNGKMSLKIAENEIEQVFLLDGRIATLRGKILNKNLRQRGGHCVSSAIMGDSRDVGESLIIKPCITEQFAFIFVFDVEFPVLFCRSTQFLF